MKTRTKGFKKIFNALLKISDDPSFKKDVSRFRKKYHIPQEGFLKSKFEDLDEITLLYPSKWKYSDSKKYPEISREVNLYIGKICQKFGLYEWAFAELMTPFFFLKNVNLIEYKKMCEAQDSHIDTCFLMYSEVFLLDAQNRQRVKISEEENKEIVKTLRDATMNFPLLIRISRSASVNEIIDFVKKNSREIKRALTRDLNTPLISARSRITRQKYDFIWNNRNIPRNMIAKLVNQKFGGNADAIYIRNIISREKKIRE